MRMGRMIFFMRWRCLLFPDVADGALAVVGGITNMDPVSDGAVLVLSMLEDELVEVEVVHHPGEPLAASGEVGDVDVGCLAEEVLGVVDASYGSVEEGGAVAGGDADGDLEVLTKGFEDFGAEDAEVVDDLYGWGVVDVTCLSCWGVDELVELEMGSEEHGRRG